MDLNNENKFHELLLKDKKVYNIRSPIKDAPNEKRIALGDITNFDKKNLPKDTQNNANLLGIEKYRYDDSSMHSYNDDSIQLSFDSCSAERFLPQMADINIHSNSEIEAPSMIEHLSSEDDVSYDYTEVPEYSSQIFQYIRELENIWPLKYDLIIRGEITNEMRSVLMDWLVEVQENFEFIHDTLHLAAKLVDYYLSKKEISRENLQLLGGVAMFLACKYEERQAPPLEDFVYICDDAYTKKQFVQMERDILITLDYNLSYPVTYKYQRTIGKHANLDIKLLTLSRYIVELTLLNVTFCQYKSSELASGSLFLTICMGRSVDMNCNANWNQSIESITGCTYESAKTVASILRDYLIKIQVNQIKTFVKLKTITSKYSHPTFYEVAKISANIDINIDILL